MSTMQVYWVKLNGAQAEPGQFIFLSNADNTVRGFVAEIDYREARALVYLFEPIEKKDFATVVHERIDDQVWVDKLGEVFAANPSAKHKWGVGLAK